MGPVRGLGGRRRIWGLGMAGRVSGLPDGPRPHPGGGRGPSRFGAGWVVKVAALPRPSGRAAGDWYRHADRDLGERVRLPMV